MPTYSNTKTNVFNPQTEQFETLRFDPVTSSHYYSPQNDFWAGRKLSKSLSQLKYASPETQQHTWEMNQERMAGKIPLIDVNVMGGQPQQTAPVPGFDRFGNRIQQPKQPNPYELERQRINAMNYANNPAFASGFDPMNPFGNINMQNPFGNSNMQIPFGMPGFGNSNMQFPFGQPQSMNTPGQEVGGVQYLSDIMSQDEIDKIRKPSTDQQTMATAMPYTGTNFQPINTNFGTDRAFLF